MRIVYTVISQTMVIAKRITAFWKVNEPIASNDMLFRLSKYYFSMVCTSCKLHKVHTLYYFVVNYISHDNYLVSRNMSGSPYRRLKPCKMDQNGDLNLFFFCWRLQNWYHVKEGFFQKFDSNKDSFRISFLPWKERNNSKQNKAVTHDCISTNTNIL